jgi:mannosyl-3-phosphoglycerate phosphatase
VFVTRLIATDLDGTLIDHHTYSAAAATEALAACANASVPVVACSSKTRAEIRRLMRTLPMPAAPVIAENGSAVWFPDDWPSLPADATSLPHGEGYLVTLGIQSARLRPELDRLASQLRIRVHALSAMTTDAVVAHTGLAPEVADLARQREFSEPFIVEGAVPSLDAMQAVALELGLHVTRGGRFFHLLGPTDKGRAVAVVRGAGTPGHRALGLGDAPNDLSLLRACDDAVIVPQPDHGIHPDLARALPTARHAVAPGPAGWNDAVLRWLDSTAV